MEIIKKKGEDLTFSVNGITLITIKDETSEPQQPATGKIAYAVKDNQVDFIGVGMDNPIIIDNDFATDSPEFPLLFLAADKGKINLVGNIMHSTLDPAWPFDRTAGHWANTMAAAKGLKNIPAPVKGSARSLNKPASGRIEDTQFEQSMGVDLIISQAKKATPEKPLVIFMGGQASTVASAYLKDKSISDRVILFHVNGFYNGGDDIDKVHHGYNTTDAWGTYILAKRMKYVCVNVKFPENRKYWYDGKNLGLTKTMIDGLPASSATTMLQKWFTDAFTREGMADSPAPLWLFDKKVWRNVQRKKVDGSTTTGDEYDFLFVNDHNWPAYGPALINAMKSLLGGTTEKPEEPEKPGTGTPIGGISSGFEEAIRTAAAGKTVVFNKGNYTMPYLPKLPVGVSVDFGGSTINVNSAGGFNKQEAFINLENGRDQTIKNGIIKGMGKASGAVMLTGCDRVHVDGLQVNDFKFFAIWPRDSKNGSIKNSRVENNSWVDGWASGDIAFHGLTSYLFENIEAYSNDPARGYGFKAMYDKRSLKDITFRNIKTRMHHNSNWNAGQSHNIGFELADSLLEGTILIEQCDFGNQVSFSCQQANPGRVIVRNSIFDVANDRYCIEGIVNNLEVYGCRFLNGSQWLFNGKPTIVVENWNIHDNEFDQGTAPSYGWGGVVLIGKNGAKGVNIKGNTIRHRKDNALLKFQGAQGGVNDVTKDNTVITF